ncbi:MAG: RNA polymerase sigma factor, partial [Bacteroidia bacterium]
LMDLIALGNRKAFEIVYERYFDKLCWYAQGFLKDEAAAEDVVQEVFIKLMDKGQSYESGRRLSTWIYTLTANRCKNVLRDDANRQRLAAENYHQEHVEIPSLFSDLDARLVNRDIQHWLKDKSEKEQNLYRLRFEQDLSVKEIAEAMEIPEGSVKSGLFYLLKKLNNPLKKWMYENE